MHQTLLCPISLAHNNTADPSASKGRVREKTPRTTVLNKGGRWRTGRLRWLGPVAAPVLRRELSLAPHGPVKATTTGRRFGLCSCKRRQGADSGYPERHVACKCLGAYTLTLANPAAAPATRTPWGKHEGPTPLGACVRRRGRVNATQQAALATAVTFASRPMPGRERLHTHPLTPFALVSGGRGSSAPTLLDAYLHSGTIDATDATAARRREDTAKRQPSTAVLFGHGVRTADVDPAGPKQH
jgi:hypothetical protein